MNKTKAIDDLRHTMKNLELNIQQFHTGERYVYRTIAVQLRLLLCDTQRSQDNSLLPRLFPSMRLHPLIGYMTKSEEADYKRKFGTTLWHMPGAFYVGKDGAHVDELFDEGRQPIGLVDWLDQPLFREEIPLGLFIRSVADKESAHSDKDYDDVLGTVKRVKIGTEDSHIFYIVAIGEYVLKWIRYATRDWPVQWCSG